MREVITCGKIKFYYYEDWSGDITIVKEIDNSKIVISIPFTTLRHLVAESVRDSLHAKIDKLSDQEIIGKEL